MTDERREPQRGQRLHGLGGQRIGTVDAVYADYLLVRTTGLPVDLYVPRSEVSSDAQGRLRVEATPPAAYDAWHRPLKRVTHD